MDEPLDVWFAHEILAHEEALVRYLRRKWRSRDDVHDLRQEAYIRVYEAASKSRPTAPKSFLFTTARNLMADHYRRERVVSIEMRGELESLNVLVDEVSPEQQASAHEDLRRLAQAFDQLPPKCREVVWMRRVEDLSQKQVADRLGISEKTVEKHVAKGVRFLANCLFGGREGEGRGDGRKESANELGHGKQQAD
jgi:RNA polymerase sigma factor (sigma-70 family)